MPLDLRYLSLVVALVLAPAACGSNGDDGDDMPAVSCAAQATLTVAGVARTATGVGTVTCDGDASIDLEVCVQWDASGSFADTQCKSAAESGIASLTVDNLTSCGLSAGRTFRARVNASINGVALAEVLSDEVVCF